MGQEEVSAFVKAYAALLKATWTEGEEFQDELLSEPEKVVREFGLNPGDAQINVITEIQEEGTVEDQARLWEEGKKKGSIDLYVPLSVPEGALDDVELSDEDLEMVAGGGCTCTGCCTCTPCCCCCC
ncbi:MAG: hypothetical protein JXJ20_05395 [Anaerolineae bacterium]|nr:hypothetical protein [Anaerolineae bacterium]